MLIFNLICLLCFVLDSVNSQIVSECLNNKEYILNEAILVHSIAKSQCATFEGSPVLATIKDQQTFDFLADFVRFTFPDEIFSVIWFGLERLNEVDPLDPLTFQFVDGSSFNAGFGDIAGVAPWRSGDPNNFNNQEKCGEFFITPEVADFNDLSCALPRPSLCERSCSTPTVEPTLTPTKLPTKTPTLSPIISPTTSPTLNPTFSPTKLEISIQVEIDETINVEEIVILSSIVVSGVLFMLVMIKLHFKIKEYNRCYIFDGL